MAADIEAVESVQEEVDRVEERERSGFQAILQAEAGATVWFYLSEKRQALLPWLWQEGWIAVVLGSLTLAAALQLVELALGVLEPVGELALLLAVLQLGNK